MKNFLKGISEFQKGKNSEMEGIGKKAKVKGKIQITQSKNVKGIKIKTFFLTFFERGIHFFQEGKNKKGIIQNFFEK